MNACLNSTLLILPYVRSANKRTNRSYTCLLYALKLAVYGTNLVHGHQARHYFTLQLGSTSGDTLVYWDEKMQHLTLVNHLILIFKRYIFT